MKFLFEKKISLFYLVVVVAVCCLLVYLTFKSSLFAKDNRQLHPAKSGSNAPQPAVVCDYNFVRLDGYEYIRPLLFVESDCESQRYAPLKADIDRKVQELKQTDQLLSVSVYFRDLKSSEWISYNDTEKYFPGSLMKLVLLIAYLKEDESQPGILQKQLTFNTKFNSDKHPVFLSKSIEFGKTYSVKELLRYMISYSDNSASYLLAINVDQQIFTKVITDLGMSAPSLDAMNYPITARAYSYFMRTVYNSTYLSMSHSEFAAELLSTCDFTQGFVQGLPQDVKIIHKFGEAGDMNVHQLHESGIIYLLNKPYLLTVMTKGKDVEKLPEVLSTISSTVYQDVSTGF